MSRCKSGLCFDPKAQSATDAPHPALLGALCQLVLTHISGVAFARMRAVGVALNMFEPASIKAVFAPLAGS